MRKSTVRTGIRLLIAAIMLVIVASFYHETVADLLLLSPGGAGQFVYLAFFWSGILGGIGIVFVIAGLIRSGAGDSAVRLGPVTLVLLLVIGLFFGLFYRSFFTPDTPPRLRPGETIII
ncbi:MAG TPA: hypothetical protein VIU41_00940 [Geobacteraceae bacterium]